ncbi:MAG: hypothetical protein ABI811_06460 [Acidobacteriota bacterium]
MRVFGLILLCSGALLAADANELSQAKIDEIIKTFAANEASFAKARESYTYRQTARIQELDRAGNTTGRWETVSDIVFETTGRRTEHVVRAPIPTLNAINLTPEDMQDLKNVQPFVLTTENLPDYIIRYLGKEKLDEIECHAFAVKPKTLVKGERYFSGIVWVDDRDLQVVKTYGRGVGIAKGQAFPKFETFRQQIDGKYWFPTYTIAEDTLHFEDSNQRIRQVVKYEDYKQFKAESTIIFGDLDEPATKPAEPAAPKPQPAKPTK